MDATQAAIPSSSEAGRWKDLDLFAAAPNEANSSGTAGSFAVTLTEEETSAVERLAGLQKVSGDAVLFSAWAVALSRWTQNEELHFSVHKSLAGESGAGVRLAQPRVEIGQQPFSEVLRTVADAFPASASSIELTPDSEIRVCAPELIGGYLRRRTVNIHTDGVPWLTLVVRQTKAHVRASVHYPVHLIEPELVERIAAGWRVLLAEAVQNPECPANLLSMLDLQQRHQVLHAFNHGEDARGETQTERPCGLPERTLLHEFFEWQAARAPDAIALITDEGVLRYDELNSRANRLAHLLREKGVGAERVVGVCLNRNCNLIIAMLAVLKAGGVYLPLDPTYPRKRLAYMIEHAGPDVLLIQEAHRAALPVTTTPVIALDTHWHEVGDRPAHNIDAQSLPLTSANLAYVIYTSGSTGLPKAVAAEHASMVNRILAQQCIAPFSEDDICVQKTSIGFVDSIFEILGPLSYGKPLVLAQDASQDVSSLASLIHRMGVTRLISVPSLARALIDSSQAVQCLRGLRGWTLSGEELTSQLLRDVREKLPNCTVTNLYGSSEVAADVTWHAATDSQRDFVPIGKPLPNVRIYILDRHLQPVPIMAAGDLYVSGSALARGYLHRADLTAERFIHDPLGTAPNARMYRTGDVARWRPDGTIEYLGRSDHQIKIRGFRVELGEIESRLASHPAVGEAVVVAREDVPGDKRLVAYVTVGRSVQPSVDELRQYLKAQLPDYMVPSAVVVLERLPTTPSGKVDRLALPAPDQHAYVSRSFEPPEGEVERALAGVWIELLHVARVGREDNFFELGGHSLQFASMMERLARVELSGRANELLATPTLAGMAKALRPIGAQELQLTGPGIPPQSERIHPGMLPLVSLTAEQIETIVRAVPGGTPAIQDIYPLTSLQEGILFHHFLGKDRGDTYVLAYLLSLPSREKLADFVGSLQRVVDRHDALRSLVLWEDVPVPVQVVLRHASVSVTEEVLDKGRDAQEQLREWMRPERQSIDLRNAPLLRLKTAADPCGTLWYVLLQIHHIIADHESLAIVLEEARAFMDGREHHLAAPVAYREHVAQTLSAARMHDSEEFFRAKLGDVEEATAPFGLMDIHVEGSRIEEAREVLDDSLARRVRFHARRHGVSAAAMFHAAWSLVVSGTSGREDVVFGTVLLGRLQWAPAQRAVGMFINTLPMRLRLHAVSAEELLQQTQRELAELLGHEHASLAEAQRCSAILGATPLFVSLLNYRHSVRFADQEQTGPDGVQLLASLDRTSYPITLSVDDFGDGFELTAQTDYRVAPDRITAYMRQALAALLDALEHCPMQPAGEISVLPDDEYRRVTQDFNATQTPFEEERLLHELFEEQVEKTPDAIAVVFEGATLTYAELNSRANQIARHLRAQGIGPDELVGICAERSLELVIGLYGILKAGAAYVPLDPGYPAERLQYMLEDAAPRIILTQERLKDKLAGGTAQVLALDAESPRLTLYDSSNLDVCALGVRSRHLAYMIYTSGSTGKPKGAMNEHRALINRLQWMQSAYRLTSDDVVLQKTPFSFDVSVWEFFWPLMTGARLVVARPQGHQDPHYLHDVIEKEGVTTLHFVPSMLQTFLTHSRPGRCSSLRQVICSGEELPFALQTRFFECFPTVRLHNLYGPTEAAIDVTAWECRPGDRGPRVPIGRPIANINMYVLSARQRPVPIGVTGEIYIGGVGVGRGYRNRPELTSERFVTDVISNDGSRMYRTGDLGRWRADGAIEYLGRTDHQIKIRGLRIELGEIEAQLCRHPHIKDAVVVAREEKSGEKRLVAYFTSDAASFAAAEELRKQLRAALPEYMVPSAFVHLHAWPLSPNGKLDRKALPAPDDEAYGRQQYEAPEGQLEELLASVWQDLLQVERVGRRDNFYELGGHSLLIVQLAERLRSVGFHAEVRELLGSATFADMANVFSRTVGADASIPPNEIPPGCTEITPRMLPLVQLEQEHITGIVRSVPGGAANIQDIYPLAPLQEGFLFHHLLSEGRADTYVVSTLLSVSSQERIEELIAALQSVVDRHDILRTAVFWKGLPEPVQVVHRQVTLPVEQISLEASRDAVTQLREWMEPQRQTMALHDAPLMRVRIAKPARVTDAWYVLLQLHHLIYDAASLRVLIRELVAHLQGESGKLLSPVPYREHVARVVRQKRSGAAEAFFRSKLADVEETTAPYGLRDVHAESLRVLEKHLQIDEDLARRTRAASRRLNASVASLFHAACALVLARITGRDDVVFGTVLLGRMHSAGAEQVVGMLINTLPLRVQLSNRTAHQLIEHTQRELIELLKFEQTSLAVAQRCSGLPGGTPLFSAVLNFRQGSTADDDGWSAAAGVKEVLCEYRTNYPLMISVDARGSGTFSLTIQSDDRIDPQKISTYLHIALSSLVEAAEVCAETPAAMLPVMPESERQQVIEAFNATRVTPAYNRLIHELFEEQVLKNPQAIAVTYRSEALTYAELNRRSNQLAHFLRRRGVGPDRLVALCIEREIEMVVALLAVLKAGGAYVPLDPSNPSERLQHVLADACPTAIVVNAMSEDARLRNVNNLICLAADEEEISRQSGENPDPEPGLGPQSLAYVIYTSGSTGRPKGVMVEHRNLVNYATHAVQQFELHCGNGSLICTSLSFDLGLTGLYPTLLAGKTVRLCPEDRGLPALEKELLRCTQIAPLKLTPSHLSLLQPALERGDLKGRVRVLVLGGEALQASAVELWRKHAPETRIFNHYGPTEATIGCVIHEITGSSPRTGTVPIGRPISNTQIFVLDKHLQPLPVAVAGDIYIGGAGVARGYWRQPALTAERFLRNPFSDDPAARLYKSGDRGRWLPNGTLEYLGRSDDQIKIRGYRIEPGEVQAQLARHEQVQECAVISREDRPGETRLVAYVVGRAPAQPDIAELRAYLKGVMPDYMVPAAFVTMKRLPITPNGKLDRRALPAPDYEAFGSSRYEAPEGKMEQTLALIWQETLGVQRVGRHDNFFEIGGHSLLAMQVAVRTRALLSVDLPMRTLFDYPALKDLARRVEELSLSELLEELAAEGTDVGSLLKQVSEVHDSNIAARGETGVRP